MKQTTALIPGERKEHQESQLTGVETVTRGLCRNKCLVTKTKL